MTGSWPDCAACSPRGKLGQHNGLPVSIVVSTTLQDLEAATGKALTGGGTLVPMSDVIRWASHAHVTTTLKDLRPPPAKP